MKQSKTTIKELTKRYRAVLLKCALLNMAITYPNPSVASEQIYNLTPHDGYMLSGQWNPSYEVDTVHLILQGNGETLNGNDVDNDISFFHKSVTLDISNISQLVNYAKAINLSGVSGVLNIYSDNEMHFNGNGSDIEIFDGTANLHSGSIYFEKGITGSKSTYNYNIGKTVNSVLNIEGATAIFENGSCISTGNLTISSGTLIANAVALQADNIVNNSDDLGIVLTGGYLTKNVTGIGRMGIVGNVVFGPTGYYSDVSQSLIMITENNSLTVGPSGSISLETEIINNGVFQTTSSVSANISGLGVTYFLNDPDSNGIGINHIDFTGTINQTAFIENKVSLSLSADSLLERSVLFNSGTVVLKGGTLSSSIVPLSQSSKIIINGDVTSAVPIENTVVNTGKKLTISASNIGENIINNGTISLSTGTLSKQLSGNIIISGQVSSNIQTNNLTINNEAVLSLSASNVGKNIVNNGIICLTGGLLNTTLDGMIDLNDSSIELGSNADLTGAALSDGTIKLTLPATAVNSAIINAGSASDVSLDVDMSKVSRDTAGQYVLTATNTGYTLLNVNNNRYAFSDATFTLDDYKADPTAYAFNTSWHGGTLYILRLATAAEGAVEDLKNIGVPVSANEEKAIEVLNDEVIEKLASAQKAAAQKINDLLETAAASGDTTQMKQILREVAPEAAPSASQTASSNAGAVISVVGTRMGGGSPAPAAGSGRSGGDYTAGAGSVWAQGMYNKAKLDKTDGFDSDSTGFAAGFEYAFNDSVKAGVGYAYTTTDIDTDRSKTDVDTHTGFVYGEYKPNNFYVNGVLSYGHSKYDETTRLAGLKSDYRANTFAGQIMSGYTFGFLTPEAGLRYTSVRQRSYTNALGAEMSEKTADTWTGVLGAKIGKNYVLRANRKIGLSPELKVAATYDFARDDENRTVTLPDGSSYTATGEAMERFGVEAGAGVTVSIANSAEIALTYDGMFKKDYQDHTGMVNLKIKF